eukprot:TRINITY_DN122345_c0_g1_i1.p1 TRINITY_DN122345_c0_g1~~TRINITY_DN122345_c0_g1_i1.p1  ORF type:complete len:538 (-),score=72.35 TRINITY_DN122345_c0_g1_i1:302-1828(-)
MWAYHQAPSSHETSTPIAGERPGTPQRSGVLTPSKRQAVTPRSMQRCGSRSSFNGRVAATPDRQRAETAGNAVLHPSEFPSLAGQDDRLTPLRSGTPLARPGPLCQVASAENKKWRSLFAQNGEAEGQPLQASSSGVGFGCAAGDAAVGTQRNQTTPSRRTPSRSQRSSSNGRRQMGYASYAYPVASDPHAQMRAVSAFEAGVVSERVLSAAGQLQDPTGQKDPQTCAGLMRDFMADHVRLLELMQQLYGGTMQGALQDPRLLQAASSLSQVMANLGEQGRQHLSPMASLYQAAPQHMVQRQQSCPSSLPPGYAWAVPVAVPVPVPAPLEKTVVADPAEEKRIRERRKSTYTVVNPRNGERVTIRTAVPFQWARNKRLSIMNPKTGEEVLPRQESTSFLDGNGESDQPGWRSPRQSMASVSSPSPLACSPAKRAARRSSIAGDAMRLGQSFSMENVLGAWWEWPLSRQEKKERVLMLAQLEMLSEIEELQRDLLAADEKSGARLSKEV